jgi:hypothetical protein
MYWLHKFEDEQQMNVFKIFDKFFNPERKCRYYNKCDFKSEQSYTCNHSGGPYCGRWKTGRIKRECLVVA